MLNTIKNAIVRYFTTTPNMQTVTDTDSTDLTLLATEIGTENF